MRENCCCCAMYLEAIKFAKQVYDILVEKRGEGNFDSGNVD